MKVQWYVRSLVFHVNYNGSKDHDPNMLDEVSLPVRQKVEFIHVVRAIPFNRGQGGADRKI